MKKILVVEDDFIIQIFLKKIISKNECSVVGSINNSEMIIPSIDQLNPHIIFMDITIEGPKNGIEMATIINKDYKIPIVYITGNTDDKTMLEAKKTNPLHIISKPVDEESLNNEIKLICKKYDELYKV